MGDKNVMFRVNVDAKEKDIIKKKAAALSLNMSAYAKMVLNHVRKSRELKLESDGIPSALRHTPECIMIDLPKGLADDLAKLAKRSGMYKSEFFRDLLVKADVSISVEVAGYQLPPHK